MMNIADKFLYKNKEIKTLLAKYCKYLLANLLLRGMFLIPGYEENQRLIILV